MASRPPHDQPEPHPSTFEPLEARELLSSHRHHHSVLSVQWVPYAHATGQDVAASQFPAINGSGVTVAVIDRGIDYNVPQLGGGIGKRAKVIGGVNFRDSSGVVLDDYGHGTGVAGIIAADGYNYGGLYNQGVAPAAKLLSLKQESSAGVKAALDWVIAHAKHFNIQVVNLTDFVTDVKGDAWDPTIYLPELKKVHDMGIFLSTPVGNGEVDDPTDPISYPGRSSYVTGVGGFGVDGQIWADSRRGRGLQVLGPAEDVTTTYYLRNRNDPGYDQFDDNYDGTPTIVNYAKGTSWASAYVAGTAALIKQVNPNITPDQIRQILRDSGTSVVDPTTGVKYPKLNIDAAIALAYQRYGGKAGANVKPQAVFSTTAIQPKVQAAADASILTDKSRVLST